MAQAQTAFTPPVIFRSPREWYIEYYYLNPFDLHTWDRFRIRGQLNYKKYEKTREQMAQDLLKEIVKVLKKGSLPSRYVELKKTPSAGLIETLETVAHKEGLGKSLDTKNAYRLMIGRLQKFLVYSNQDGMALDQFDGSQAQEFKEYLVEQMELKNVTVNCTIQPIKMFLERLYMEKKISNNPFYHVKYLPKRRGSTFIALDLDEKTRIAAALQASQPELYLFCNMIYSCFIRPIELCALTPGDIDLKNDWIQVKEENSKVAHTSFRQIMPGLKKMILDYNILSMPKNSLVFQAICGNDNLLRSRRKKVSLLYKKVVKVGLGIDKEMYGLKHTGNIDYLKSLPNIGQANLQWLKQQNDHTTLETTQNYIRDLGVIKIDKQDLKFNTF